MANHPQENGVSHESASSIPLVSFSLGLLLLLAALDQTIVSTALPTMVSDLGGLDNLSWVVTSYILASTVVLPLYGKLGDLYGRRSTVFVSVGLFLFGSVLCGMANSMTFLIVSRAIQGFGGGGLFVLALSVIGDIIPPKDRGKIQGLFAAVFSVASVIGPLMGGWFVEVFNWRWIFYFNIPIGIFAVLGFAASFKAKVERISRKIDWGGAVTLSIALSTLTLIASLGGRTYAWSSWEILVLSLITIASTLLFLWIEARVSEPILPLALFKMNVFWVTNIIGLVVGASLFGTITFLPLYLQIAKGISPTVSGLMLIPMTIGILVAATVAGISMGKTGKYRWLPIVGTIFLFLGMLSMTTLASDTSTLVFSLCIGTVGLGLGCIFPVVTTAVQNAVSRDAIGTATAAGLMFRQIGGTIAVSVYGAMFSNRLIRDMVESGLEIEGGMQIGPQTLASLPPQVQEMLGESISSALHPIYACGTILAVIGFLFALILQEIPLKSKISS